MPAASSACRNAASASIVRRGPASQNSFGRLEPQTVCAHIVRWIATDASLVTSRKKACPIRSSCVRIGPSNRARNRSGGSRSSHAARTAAVRAACEDLMPPDLFLARFDGPIRDQLERIGHAFFRLVTSEASVAIHRTMCAQTVCGSSLPKLFWEAGPRRTMDALAAFLQAEDEAGVLDVPDPALAASQFFCLLKGEAHARMVCGCPVTLAPADVQRHVAATVDLFLRAYGPGRR